MNKEQIDKIVNDLENEKAKNIKDLGKYKYRKKVVSVNTFHNNFMTSFGLSMLGYFALILVLIALVANFGIVFFTNNLLAISAGLIAIPSLAGIGLNKILNKKSNIKNKLKEFSNAKNEKEKLEEIIKYEIEIEKIKNRNLVFDTAKNELIKNYEILNSLSDKYDIKEKEENITPEIVNNNYKNLEKSYEELDLLSTKKVICDRFDIYREKGGTTIKTFGDMVIPGLFSMLIPHIPIICIGINSSTPILPSFAIFSPIITFTLGLGISGVYTAKRNKENKEIFTKMNNELGNEKLNDIKEDIGLDNEFVKQINNTISEIVPMLINDQKIKNPCTGELKQVELIKNEETKEITSMLHYNIDEIIDSSLNDDLLSKTNEEKGRQFTLKRRNN